MDTAPHPSPTAGPPLTEALARILRHEVGDLLQTIYATAAILQERLPPGMTLERRVVTDLRSRAETCKVLLDTVHDYVCDLSLNGEPVNPAELAAGQVAAAAARRPRLQVSAEAVGAIPTITADPRRLAQVVSLLLAYACDSAREKVQFRTAAGPNPGEVEWTVTDDSPGVTPEQRARLFSPYPINRHSPLGLGLGLARKIVLLHGGQIAADEAPDGGLRIRVVLPPASPEPK